MPKDGAAATLDEALGRLRRRSSVDDKLAALRLLVEYRHGPIVPEDAIPATELAGLALPKPLLWWYRWAGRRTSVMSGQNFLWRPGDPDPYRRPRIDGDRLLFHVENQGCYAWSTLTEGDDPPVFGTENGYDPWEAEGPTLSEHLVLTCIFEAVVCHAAYRACSACPSELELNAIAEHAPALAIGPWRWCDTHFHAGGGAFMSASVIGEANDLRLFSVWIGARREGVLDFLEPLLGDEWELAEL